MDFFWILATLLFCDVGASEPMALGNTCPTYLREGEDLSCECHPTSPDTSCKTYWLGHQPYGTRLQKPNITRDNNGTRFTCEMDCDGQKSSTDYTLQVAYGPSQSSVSVQGSLSLIADGNQTMTLTCVSGDMNPAPFFKWTNKHGLQCENGDTKNTCLIRPTKVHDGKNVSCRVSNVETATYKNANSTLHLKYPPPTRPELSGYNEGTPLKPGDTLECTVKGGNPPVSTVILTCSDLTLSCQRRTTGDSRVTSCQLDFKEDKRDTEEVQCSCSAVWEPDPQLYVHVATDTIKVGIKYQFPPAAGGHGRQGPQTEAGTGAGTGSIGLIIGVILARLLVIAIPVVVFVICRRKRRPKYDEHDMECAQSLNKVEDDTSRDTTQPEDVETDCVCSTLPGCRESILLSSAKSVSERDVEEPAGDYSTVLEEMKGGVTTPVKVLTQDTSNGYTEVQLEKPAEPELPVSTVNPHNVVDISQLDLPKPEVCLPTSHFASFMISQSTPKYRGPLGDKYTLVDKKKVYTVVPGQNFKTEAVKMKNPEAEDCDDGTQGKLH